MKRGDHPVNLQSAFSPGAVTATGERIFVPFRKRTKQEEEIDSNLKSNGIKSYGVVHHSSVLSDDEVKLIRLQNQISLEGSDIVCNPILKFSNAGLHPIFIQRLQEKGITIPKPVQMQGIPLILSGRDVVIHSNTGSGKTLTFVLPLLQLLTQLPLSTPETGPIALIIAPTRELADQIMKELSFFLTSSCFPFFHNNHSYPDLDYRFFAEDGRLQHRLLGVWGGEKFSSSQYQELGKGIDVLVSTPGRLIDLMSKGVVGLSNIRYFVLDEADKACDIEMENQIRAVGVY